MRSTAWFLSRLVRFRPWLWGINLFCITALVLINMVPGLIVREFFNRLTASAPAALGLPALVALLLAA
ncbi:MAG TPA: ABC transporter ATP-binding protein, partial [Chloroflexota bacterium]